MLAAMNGETGYAPVKPGVSTPAPLRTVAGMVFRYAIATGRAERDISLDLRGALITPKVQHRPAITDPKKAGALLRAIDGYGGQVFGRRYL